MNLGNKITELRKLKRWSRSELARQIEVSREIVGRYERRTLAVAKNPIQITNIVFETYSIGWYVIKKYYFYHKFKLKLTHFIYEQ